MRKENLNENLNENFKQSGADAKEDITSIKEDIKNLLGRLSDLTEESKNILFKESEQLITSLLDMKNQMLDKSNHQLQEIATYAKHNPLKSMIFAFSMGIILSALCRIRK